MKLQSGRSRRVKRSRKQSARTTEEQGRPQEAFVFRGHVLCHCSPLLKSFVFPLIAPLIVLSHSRSTLSSLTHVFRTIGSPSFLKPSAGSRPSVISSSSELLFYLNHLIFIPNRTPAPCNTLPHTHTITMLSYGSIAVALVQRRVMVVQG